MTQFKPKHPWLLASALLIAGVFLGIRHYALQLTIPKGVTVAGWNIGGLSIQKTIDGIKEKNARTAGTAIILFSNQGIAETKEASAGVLGLRVDTSLVEKTLTGLEQGSLFQRALKRYRLSGSELTPSVLWNPEILHAFIAKAWSPLQTKAPVAAKRTITETDQIVIIPDRPVFRIDENALLDALRRVDWLAYWRENSLTKKPLRLELPLRSVRAKVTYESLAAQHIERKISEFTTEITPGNEGRLHNITSTARTVNDTLLKPGGIFDYASIVERTEETYGFKEAPVIFNGKLVPGVGGGICQVSSTLYNAVLRAGIEIVERRNHSLPVSYVPLGQDATFSTGYINFRFKNDTSSYVLIRTAVKDSKLTVKLFGSLPMDLSYTIDSVKVRDIDIPVKYVRNPILRPGETETLQQGKPGYVVDTFRTKKINGTIVAKERISRDYYSPQPTLVAVGVSPSDPPLPQNDPSPNIVEDGVKGPRFP